VGFGWNRRVSRQICSESQGSCTNGDRFVTFAQYANKTVSHKALGTKPTNLWVNQLFAQPQRVMLDSTNPTIVVQRQLDAYNNRDLEALLSIYADEAEMFEHPSTLLAKGSSALRERFVARFQEPNLHAKLLSRMVMGQTVIDYEEITRTFPEGSGRLFMIMIYEVAGNRIAKAWSIAGAKILD
jgi:hypothetical protein